VFNRNIGVLKAAMDGLAATGVRAVVAVGPDGDPHALGPLPPAATALRYVAHGELLPSCAALVSHAGAATMLVGIGHGLPQLFLPQAGDQFVNAALGERAGVGLVLRGPEAGAGAIGAAVRRLLDDPSFAAAARRVGAEIAAMPQPSTLVPVLEELAAGG
jgi:UDP:flavonoid glycosyltransferase YjiC (YdhE family)